MRRATFWRAKINIFSAHARSKLVGKFLINLFSHHPNAARFAIRFRLPETDTREFPAGVRRSFITK